MEPIVIGQIIMPINVLVQNTDCKKVCFDGKVKISLKQNVSIGYLRVKISYADINLYN
jgi:hypothetical protein